MRSSQELTGFNTDPAPGSVLHSWLQFLLDVFLSHRGQSLLQTFQTFLSGCLLSVRWLRDRPVFHFGVHVSNQSFQTAAGVEDVIEQAEPGMLQQKHSEHKASLK